MLDDDIVNEFLDIAVENGLIDKARRDSIIGYELYRGDRTLDKSVIGPVWLMICLSTMIPTDRLTFILITLTTICLMICISIRILIVRNL